MFKRSLLVLAFASLTFSAPAFADDGCDGGCRGSRDWRHDRSYRDRDHRGWDRHHEREYRRPRTSVSFNFGPSPYYYRQHYYQPRPVFYAPPAPAPQVIYINDSNSREISSNDGRYCREYQNTSRVGGTLQQTYGTACMQPDGSWEIVS